MKSQVKNLSTLKIIHFAFIAGVSIFLGVSFMTAETRMTQPNEMFGYVGIFIAITSVPIAFLIPNLFAKSNNSINSGQIQKYQSIKIVQWALLEGPALLNVVIFFMTGNLISVYVAIFLLLVLASKHPTEVEMNKLVIL